MKNILYLCLCCSFLFACSDSKDELTSGGEYNENIVSKPPKKDNSIIDDRLFDVINLNYPGLEQVKKYYEEDELYYAAYELLKYYRNRSNIENPFVNLINPSATSTEISMADQALDYRFYIRNFQETTENGLDIYYSFKDTDSINWNYVPEDVKDQEFRYQLHRHQWMLPQAKVYGVTKEEKYFISWKEVYQDWLKKYPSEEANGKKMEWDGLQSASRVLDQLNIFPYYIHSKNFTAEWLSQFLTAFYDHVECVKENYRADKTSNIYLTQVASVISAGILMPEFVNSNEWLNDGMTRISSQVESQFLEDGVQNELDPSYHIAAIADFYDMYLLAQSNNKLDLFSPSYIPSLHKAARFVMDITFPNYSLDNFNDTRASSYSKSVLLKNFRKYAEMFTNDQEIKWMATEGKYGVKPTDKLRSYEASGYYMLRNGWDYSSTMMILKNNLNPNNKWHNQPDNGTFAIYKQGRNFFPDAGVYSYGGSYESNQDRFRFATTKMHNTLTQFEKNISKGDMNGRLLKKEVKDNTMLLVTENASYPDLTHRRAVFFIDDTFFVLIDEGYGIAENTKVNLNFHLVEGIDNVAIDDTQNAQFIYGAHSTFKDNNNMLIKTFVETSQDYSAKNFVTEVSNKLQVVSGKRKSYQVTIRKRGADKAARFITVIHPFYSEGDFQKLDIRARFTDNTTENAGLFHKAGVKAEIVINGKKYDLSYAI